MEFLDVPEDILNYNLAFYDLRSAISLGQTNRYLHSLVFRHSTFVALVEHLQYRGFIDLLVPADGIRAMSMESLVVLAKSIVLGPTTWFPPASTETTLNKSPFFRRMVNKGARSSPGALTHPTTIHATPKLRKVLDNADLPVPLTRTAAELLPGGKYLLYYYTHTIECWRVLDGTLVWQHHSKLPDARVLHFAAHLLDGGEQLNLLICFHTSLEWGTPFVQIVTLDLKAGFAETMSSLEFRINRIRFFQPSCPRIFDEFSAVKMCREEEELYVIINWRTQSYCKILGGLHLALHPIPGHFVLASTSTPTGKVDISVISIKHLSPYWVAFETDTPGNTVDASHLPRASSQIIGIFPTLLGRRSEHRRVSLAVHENPLERGVYRIWLSLRYPQPLAPDNSHAWLYKFRLALGIGTPRVSWRQVGSAQQVSPALHAHLLSYSGHMLHRQQIIPPGNSNWQVALGEGATQRSEGRISPYSGALSYAASDHKPVVEWYE